jgi:hypothetical protein
VHSPRLKRQKDRKYGSGVRRVIFRGSLKTGGYYLGGEE